MYISSSASAALVWQIFQKEKSSYVARTYKCNITQRTHIWWYHPGNYILVRKKCINIFFFSLLLLFFRKNKFSFIETIHAIFNIIFTNYEWIYELWIRCLQLDTNKFSLEIRLTRPKRTYINIYAQHIFLIKCIFSYYYCDFLNFCNIIIKLW